MAETKKKKRVTSNWKMKYEVNGRRHTFEKIYLDEDGIPYGYCAKERVWAWLYNNAISRYGTDIEVIPAKRLTSDIYYSDGRVVSAKIVQDDYEKFDE